jgi:hypothetical protein
LEWYRLPKEQAPGKVCTLDRQARRFRGEARLLNTTVSSLHSPDVLHSRPPRARGDLTEIAAYERLHEALLRTADELLQVLVETANELFGTETSGVSLLEAGADGGEIFRWHALAGRYARSLGAPLPRDQSPCGHVLERHALLLMRQPRHEFPLLENIDPPIEEALLAPFHVDGAAVGTVWLVLHRPGQMFDAEDARLLNGASP